MTPLDDQAAAELRAGGWNLGWAKRPEDLDVYDRHGMRVMLEIGTPDVDDPVQAKALGALVARVRNHPALYAYYIVDEPGSGAFQKLGKIVERLRHLDPSHLAYINLLPTYASSGQLQVSDAVADRARVGYPQDFAGIHVDDTTSQRYREYLRQFVQEVKPDLISYDHYHFLKSGDGSQYFLNLSLIRSAAVSANMPFLNIIQACDSPAEGWREPSEEELSWLTYTSLAYGAQGISHFRYDTGFFNDPKVCRNPRSRFWTASRLNRDFVAIATQLQPLKSLGAFHCETTIPLGAERLPTGSVVAPESAGQDVLLGYFGKSMDHPTDFMVVNLDYKSSLTLKLKVPGAMKLFHPPTNAWRPLAGEREVKLVLPPGGGVLIRKADV
jgi:hypothetical protein